MNTAFQIIGTAAITIIAGMLLLVAGELLKITVFGPLGKFREHVQIVLDRLDYYANRITNYVSQNPSDEEWAIVLQMTDELRSSGTKLKSLYAGIFLKRLLVRMRTIPRAEDINTAYGSLIYLSNSVLRRGQDQGIASPSMNRAEMDKITKALT